MFPAAVQLFRAHQPSMAPNRFHAGWSENGTSCVLPNYAPLFGLTRSKGREAAWMRFELRGTSQTDSETLQ